MYFIQYINICIYIYIYVYFFENKSTIIIEMLPNHFTVLCIICYMSYVLYTNLNRIVYYSYLILQSDSDIFYLLLSSCSQRNHTEHGHMCYRNIMVTIMQQKYINKIKVHLLSFVINYTFFSVAQQPLVNQDFLTMDASSLHSDTPLLVGFLWTSDQPDAKTSTLQHTTFKRDRHPCLWLYSNPHYQQASGCRPNQRLRRRGH